VEGLIEIIVSNPYFLTVKTLSYLKLFNFQKTLTTPKTGCMSTCLLSLFPLLRVYRSLTITGVIDLITLQMRCMFSLQFYRCFIFRPFLLLFLFFLLGYVAIDANRDWMGRYGPVESR